MFSPDNRKVSRDSRGLKLSDAQSYPEAGRHRSIYSSFFGLVAPLSGASMGFGGSNVLGVHRA